MNKIIIKCFSGSISGFIGSWISITFANCYESTYVSLNDFIKKKFYLPLAFGGITGFFLGFYNTP